jgi:arginine repressor
MGTIAGDDTILLVCRERARRGSGDPSVAQDVVDHLFHLAEGSAKP